MLLPFLCLVVPATAAGTLYYGLEPHSSNSLLMTIHKFWLLIPLLALVSFAPLWLVYDWGCGLWLWPGLSLQPGNLVDLSPFQGIVWEVTGAASR